MLLIVLLCLVGLAAAFFAAHSLYRALARQRHTIAAPGIDEAGWVEIGGIRQYIQIRGQNAKNPVLLVLHGGPGTPLSAMNHAFQYEWEKDFTVVQWDQRQAGKTYYANDPKAVAETLKFDTVLEDAWQVTQYLQKRLGAKKIALMGHSWGTVLGTALAQTHPEAFSCYIGVGQVTDLKSNERVGYEKALELARKAQNAADVAALEALEGYPGQVFDEAFCSNMLTLRKYQQKYGLADAISLKNVLLVMGSPYYNFFEALYYTKNTVALHGSLFRYMFEKHDARAFGAAYPMPVYYIMGENDFQTPVTLAKELFSEIEAPQKQLFLIEGAGHFTMVDNPDNFNRALLGGIRPTLETQS